MIALHAQTNQPSSYEFNIPTTKVKPMDGRAYFVPLPPAMPKGVLRIDSRLSSESDIEATVLTESGRVLGPGNVSDRDVVLAGEGRYMVKNMWLLFSASDGSNPATNRKLYHFSTFLVIHPLFKYMVLALLGWASIWVFIAFRRSAH